MTLMRCLRSQGTCVILRGGLVQLMVVVHNRTHERNGVQKVNGGQDICSRVSSAENMKNCEKHAR